MPKRMDVQYLGRTLGTASGWDGDPGEWLCFDDFKPCKGVNLPEGELHINEIGGTYASATNEDGSMVAPQDVVLLLADIPRTLPID